MQMPNRDDQFKQLMQGSKLSLNSENFEDDIILKIQERAIYIKNVNKNIKVSIVFLIVTVIVGLIISDSFFKFNLINPFSKYALILFQMLIVFAFLFLLEGLIKLSKIQKEPLSF